MVKKPTELFLVVYFQEQDKIKKNSVFIVEKEDANMAWGKNKK